MISCIFGKSEIVNKGNSRPALLADAVESVIGAIYIEAGFDKALEFVVENLKDNIKNASSGIGLKDYKTILQEKLQVNGDVSIEYILIKESGPDHNKIFTVELKCNGKHLATGERKNEKRSRNGGSKGGTKLMYNVSQGERLRRSMYNV